MVAVKYFLLALTAKLSFVLHFQNIVATFDVSSASLNSISNNASRVDKG